MHKLMNMKVEITYARESHWGILPLNERPLPSVCAALFRGRFECGQSWGQEHPRCPGAASC